MKRKRFTEEQIIGVLKESLLNNPIMPPRECTCDHLARWLEPGSW
ncbi:hypothetical protein EV656_1234 [Rhodovulum adriaticum]|uniref:Transposase n=1 Tax=Rhodovulum adriaticum TaxID=35804 RepID=A0A4R2NFP9_RHOAD|nr:hypothetical protein EV656_1234 [Rhodovulum adriaticum]